MKINLNPKQRQWLAYAIVAVVLSAIYIGLGVSYPAPGVPGNELVGLGTAYFRNLEVAGNAVIDGAADAIQLRVQGNATQNASLMVLETSAGTDQLTVSNAGNIFVNGTSDLRGNVSDGGGVFTIADNTMIDGASDAVQLTVQGWTTQTTSLFVVENSAGTDWFGIDSSGNVGIIGSISDSNSGVIVNDPLQVLGASDLTGDVADSTGSLTLADNVVITGTANIQGDISDSGGNVTVADALDVTGATTVGGLVTVNDNAVITGTLDLQGVLSDSGGPLILGDDLDITGIIYDGGGDLVLDDTVDITGDVHDSGGTFTINDATRITSTLMVDGVATFNSDVIVDDVLNVDDNAYTLTGTQTLTPTASFYVINASSILTLTLGTSGVSAGDIIIINNISANNVNIADTNVRTTTGAALDLGQYDVVAFIFNGTSWIELWLSVNS